MAEFIDPCWIPQRYGGPVPDGRLFIDPQLHACLHLATPEHVLTGIWSPEETGVSFAGPVDPSDYAYAHFTPTTSASVSKRDAHTTKVELATGEQAGQMRQQSVVRDLLPSKSHLLAAGDVYRWAIGSHEVNDISISMTDAAGQPVLTR